MMLKDKILSNHHQNTFHCYNLKTWQNQSSQKIEHGHSFLSPSDDHRLLKQEHHTKLDTYFELLVQGIERHLQEKIRHSLHLHHHPNKDNRVDYPVHNTEIERWVHRLG